MIYVPSQWWHEVITDDDEEAMSMGVNYFFDPFFVRNRDRAHVFMHRSRMYAHLAGGGAAPCTGRHVCFTEENTDESSTGGSRSHSSHSSNSGGSGSSNSGSSSSSSIIKRKKKRRKAGTGQRNEF
jgi:uncharacterized membrane protein YgcG